MKQNEINEQGYLLVPTQWIKSVNETLQKILTTLEESNQGTKGEVSKEYLTEAEAREILNKKTTWFWAKRKSGELPFSRIGKTVYYRETDLKEYIRKNMNSLPNLARRNRH